MDILSSLKLVRTELIRLHEPTEPTRLNRTLRSIQEEQMLKNPLIAISLSNKQYLILDGAHRYHVLKNLGCDWIPIQIVDSSKVTLDSWDHLVPDGLWFKNLQTNKSLFWTEHIQKKPLVAEIVQPCGKKNYVYPKSPTTSSSRLRAWKQIVESYSSLYPVTRLPQGACTTPDSETVLLRYPAYTISDLKQIILSNEMVPAGVTRSIIDGRLLNLQIPLYILTSLAPNKIEWNSLCHQWSTKLRLYKESVYFCEI